MAVLWFIGAGLDDERGLGAHALDVLRAAGTIVVEEYTAPFAPGSVDRLAARLGRPIERLDRAAVEDGRPILDALARGGDVAFVVAGDPFAATTHVAVRLAAERAGHDWRYLPNASILTAAAGFLGLSPYRFGAVASLPFPEPGFRPTSPVEKIARNRAADLHSLVLLDLRPAEGRYLTATEALAILVDRDPEARAIPRAAPLGVVARAGTDGARAWWAPVAVLKGIDFGPPLHCLLVPAPTLHFEEEAAVSRFRPSAARSGPPSG
jgi:diphthine synthase